MFSGIFNAVSRLVAPGSNQSGDDDNEPTGLALPSYGKEQSDKKEASYSYPSSYSYQENTDDSTASVDPNNVKTVQGTVTQLLSSGYGLIDNDIVFTYDAVIGKEASSCGGGSPGRSVREHAAGGWKAKRVSLTLDWNVDDPSAVDPVEIQTIVGTVTKVSPKTGDGFINENIAFDQDALAHGFKPCRGDWIEAELHTNPETQQDFAKNVRPLRHRQFDGVVTHSYPGYGYIDNKIYFMFSNCKNGYRPKKGDPVVGKAIESDQSKGRWRAIEVEAKRVYRR
ncbi:RNA helicase Mov10l1-like [Amphiura filiformis]|uniref:RNA helicase Mov10l1-like n=1 Tax=Amphiura filiformis TaxID=82378 RepID=UPI003B2165B5